MRALLGLVTISLAVGASIASASAVDISQLGFDEVSINTMGGPNSVAELVEVTLISNGWLGKKTCSAEINIARAQGQKAEVVSGRINQLAINFQPDSRKLTVNYGREIDVSEIGKAVLNVSRELYPSGHSNFQPADSKSYPALKSVVERQLSSESLNLWANLCGK